MKSQQTAWFVVKDCQQHGPFSDQDVQADLASGILKPMDMVWREGMPDWQTARVVFQLPSSAPPPIPPRMMSGQTSVAARPTAAPQQVQARQDHHQNTIPCSFCKSELPEGATICTGCQARYGYGPAGLAGAILLIVLSIPAGALLGWYLGWLLALSMPREFYNMPYLLGSMILGATLFTLGTFVYFNKLRKKWWRSVGNA